MADFRELLEEEIPHLRRYALMLLRDLDSSDDLVHETLVRALDKFHLWTPGTNLRAWLFTILHNLFVSQYRKRKREENAFGPMDAVSEVAPANQDHHLALRDLERALWGIPDEQRDVVLLVGLEGLSYDEVATILEVPVGTVRSRLSRGRQSLREKLGTSIRSVKDQDAS